MTDYDSPWKEAIEAYFEQFMLLFFPHIHAEIAWPRGFEMLDKELQQSCTMPSWADALPTSW